MTRILVLSAHPDLRQSHVNRALLRAARALQAGEPARFEVRDLYALYPDYAIDVAHEQAEAARADLVVWQHPIHWYSMPPLMKLWLDDVLSVGWAYGHGAQALAGKDLWPVLSTGGGAETYRPNGYNRHFFDDFMPPYEQTAALCGLRCLPPFVLHGAHRATPDEIAAHADMYRQRLASYPDWPEIAELADSPPCVVPDADRPQVDGPGGETVV
jgi:glutathione-regulated potassium-efflux system ancillary protein KefF